MNKELTPEELREYIIEKSIYVKPLIEKGVYFLIRNNEIVYIGQSNNVLRRLGEHLVQQDPRRIFDSIAIQYMPNSNRNERKELEKKYILCLRPEGNNLRWEQTQITDKYLEDIINKQNREKKY